MEEPEDTNQLFLDDLTQLADPLSPQILGDVSKELVIEFFSVFSRFEHAMKCGNFSKRSQRGDWIDPDWIKLCSSIGVELLSINVPILQESIQYLANTPPKKQKSSYSWENSNFPNELTNIGSKALWSAKNVRNNLFHGGKYFAIDKERDENLIRYALIVIKTCLLLDNSLREWYEIPPFKQH